MSENGSKKKSIQIRCPGCGANMKFSAKHGKLFCEHCEGVVEVKKDYDVRERDFSELRNVSRWTESDVNCYVCKNCGAHSVLPKTTLSTKCCYCDSAVVLEKNDLGMVKPNTVIPFEVTCDQAKKAILIWRKKRFFAPTSYKKHLDVDSIKGVYTPIWTFDCYTTSNYSGRLGKRKTRTVRRNGKTYTETYIQWFSVSGTINRNFDDILVRGSRNVPQKDFNNLKPYPQSKYVVYSDEYLAGFMADNYSVEPEDAFLEAQKQMKKVLESEILACHNADVVGNLDLDLNFISKSFKYLFAPVYITATRFREKSYNNFVSGIKHGRENSIKVSGNAPKSPLKIALLVLLVLALVACFVTLAIVFGGDDFALDFFDGLLDFFGKADFRPDTVLQAFRF